MRFFSLVSLVCFTLLLASAPVSNAQESDGGKKLFLDNKCNSCHAVESRGIQKKGAASSGEKKGPPDLSGIGSTRKAEWLTGYMKKENDIQGKKHIKAWTGNDEDLATLVRWMESLKKK